MTQTSNRFFDEIGRLMNDAAGAAQGVKREVDTVVRNQAEKILRDLDIVKREEFEAVKDMARLAREESAHLAKVLQWLERRGLALGRDKGDPYAQGLQALVRTPARERQLDRLLVAALIEARSCERLGLLASGLPRGELRDFYAALAQSEDGHQRLAGFLIRRSADRMCAVGVSGQTVVRLHFDH